MTGIYRAVHSDWINFQLFFLDMERREKYYYAFLQFVKNVTRESIMFCAVYFYDITHPSWTASQMVLTSDTLFLLQCVRSAVNESPM